jgi:hypothetical protein
LKELTDEPALLLMGANGISDDLAETTFVGPPEPSQEVSKIIRLRLESR